MDLTAEPVILTFTGRRVNPLALKVEDVDILDIAHSNATFPRFCGHAKKPITVGQHEVYAAYLGYKLDGAKVALACLVHDAAEAYLGDVTKWLKHSPGMAAYREAEKRAQAVINQAFDVNLTEESWATVKYIDRLLVRYEGMKGFGEHWSLKKVLPDGGGSADRYPPLTEYELSMLDAMFGGWRFWPWQQTEQYFLDTFQSLQDGEPLCTFTPAT